METEYFYCTSCGYEDFDLFVAYSRTTAEDTDWYICPCCKEESSYTEPSVD